MIVAAWLLTKAQFTTEGEADSQRMAAPARESPRVSVNPSILVSGPTPAGQETT
jgi:hypothetical protein